MFLTAPNPDGRHDRLVIEDLTAAAPPVARICICICWNDAVPAAAPDAPQPPLAASAA